MFKALFDYWERLAMAVTFAEAGEPETALLLLQAAQTQAAAPSRPLPEKTAIA